MSNKEDKPPVKVIFTEGFLDDCEQLGLAPVKGWSLRKLYRRLVPYDWRPSQIWYRFKCWAWYRYTTVRPRTLPFHTWCDRDHLILHCAFEILCQFVEKELKDKDYRNEDDPKFAKDMATIRELYRWWREDYPDLEPNSPETFRLENLQLHRLINVRKCMWT